MTRRLIKDPSLDVGRIREDGRILASYYGYLASPADTRAVTRAVKRYYAIAATGNGKRACAMIASRVIAGIVASFGQAGSGGADTCAAVVARMLRDRRRELAAPIALTGVLTRRNNAYALIDSATMSPSIVGLVREHGSWMISVPLGSPVPRAK